ISDVANVKDSFEEEREIAKTMGEKSINLTVRIKENYDIIKLVTSVRKEVRSFEKTIPDNFKIVETDDLSQYVVRRLDVLKGNAGFGFALVIATLFFAFGWRIALVAAMGIPLSFAGTFFWMETANVSINLMSMFGLIMVLGMLVDDAIVVSENIYRLIEEKVPLKQAVVQGTSEVIVPVAGTILTTIVAFAPLMFMSGIIGKFVYVHVGHNRKIRMGSSCSCIGSPYIFMV
ncbi:MAG: efflux RND transporter permease subunit, partial [Spirochaetes bacterium]|nr:efflux RND transporter permease subunit [Spirochaetota bacterium]